MLHFGFKCFFSNPFPVWYFAFLDCDPFKEKFGCFFFWCNPVFEPAEIISAQNIFVDLSQDFLSFPLSIQAKGVWNSAKITKISLCFSALLPQLWKYLGFLSFPSSLPEIFDFFQRFEGKKKKKKVEMNRNLLVSVLDIILFSSFAGLAAGGCLGLSLEVLGQTRGGTATQQIEVGFLELISFPTHCCVRKAAGNNFNIQGRFCAVCATHILFYQSSFIEILEFNFNNCMSNVAFVIFWMGFLWFFFSNFVGIQQFSLFSSPKINNS